MCVFYICVRDVYCNNLKLLNFYYLFYENKILKYVLRYSTITTTQMKRLHLLPYL